VLNAIMLFEMRAERISCARNITVDWIEIQNQFVTRRLVQAKKQNRRRGRNGLPK